MNFGAISVELLLTFLLILVICWDLVLPKKMSGRYMGYFVAIFTLGIIFHLLYGYFSWESISFLPNKFFILDTYAIFFKVLFLFVLFFMVLFSVDYVEQCVSLRGEFYALSISATLGICVLASVTDFITLFVGLELMTISFYILAGIRHDARFAGEGALKYLLTGATSTAVLLYGISLLYGTYGTMNFMEIFQNFNSFEVMTFIGLVLIVAGFFFKLSVIFFHMWAVDVYEASPAPITFFLMSGSKIAALAIFIRVLCLPFALDTVLFLIGIFSFLSMVLGNIMAIKQQNVKRMLAYSSVAQIGYILVGIYAFSFDGIKAVLFYAMLYLFANIGAFAVLTMVEKKRNSTTLKDFEGLSKTSPLMALVMTISLLSMAGIPPTAGFAGKIYLFSAALDAGGMVLVVTGFIMSMISVYYYLLVVKAMYLVNADVEDEKMHLTIVLRGVLLVSAFLTLLCGVYFEGFSDLCTVAVHGFMK